MEHHLPRVTPPADTPPLAYFCGGVGMTLVGAAAIAAVLDADVGPRSQLVALVVFSCVAFAQTAIPLLSLVAAPKTTRAALEGKAH